MIPAYLQAIAGGVVAFLVVWGAARIQRAAIRRAARGRTLPMARARVGGKR